MRSSILLSLCALPLSCSEPEEAQLPVPGPDTEIVLGCPSWPDPIATPDQSAPETYENFAAPLFERLCVRCHSTETVGDARNSAPEGYDWDDVTSVYAHLDEIREAIGVANFMPPDDPFPTCEERARMLRWIDVGAP